MKPMDNLIVDSFEFGVSPIKGAEIAG